MVEIAGELIYNSKEWCCSLFNIVAHLAKSVAGQGVNSLSPSREVENSETIKPCMGLSLLCIGVSSRITVHRAASQPKRF